MKLAGGLCGYYGRMRQTDNENSQNSVHWADKNLHNAAPTSLEEAKVTFRCGIANTFVLSPYFFKHVFSTGMKTCSITSARDTTMLQVYVIPELQQRNVFNDIVWMENGALPHFANVFYKGYNSTLLIDSSPVTLQFRATAIPRSHCGGFLVLGLCEIDGVHII